MSAGAGQSESLDRLARLWGLTLRAAEKVRKVWRLETREGVYCLKRFALGGFDFLFLEHAARHLAARGFQAFLPPVRTLTGATAANCGGETFLLYPWVDGREADFDLPEDLAAAVRLLAELHETGAGFIPYTSDPGRVRWGLWPRILAARLAQLREFGERAASLRRNSDFCAAYAHLFPYYYAQAGRALAGLDTSPYHLLTQTAIRRRTLCHHDFSARNIVIARTGRPMLVDFDYCLADLRLHDLANLVLRLLRRDRWQPAAAAEVLNLYGQHSPLDELELRVLHPILLWPQDFWQIGLQYFLEELPWSPERFLRTLRRKTEDRAERAAFLRWYAATYL